MKEQEILYKLNKMKDSHEINTLKKQVQEHKREIVSNKTSFKEAAGKYHSLVQDSIIKLQNEIATLNREKAILQNENKTYKKMLKRIPKFIVKLFNKNEYKFLDEGDEIAAEKKW